MNSSGKSGFRIGYDESTAGVPLRYSSLKRLVHREQWRENRRIVNRKKVLTLSPCSAHSVPSCRCSIAEFYWTKKLAENDDIPKKARNRSV